MMEANGNNNNGVVNQEQTPDVIVDVATSFARWQKCLKLNFILDHQDEFPACQQTKIDELLDEFLTNLEDDVHDMLCDYSVRNHLGLDSNRDKEAEVETAIRFFPEV